MNDALAKFDRNTPHIPFYKSANREFRPFPFPLFPFSPVAPTTFATRSVSPRNFPSPWENALVCARESFRYFQSPMSPGVREDIRPIFVATSPATLCYPPPTGRWTFNPISLVSLIFSDRPVLGGLIDDEGKLRSHCWRYVRLPVTLLLRSPRVFVPFRRSEDS